MLLAGRKTYMERCKFKACRGLMYHSVSLSSVVDEQHLPKRAKVWKTKFIFLQTIDNRINHLFWKNFSLSIACLLSMSKPSQPSYGRVAAASIIVLLSLRFLNLWISQKFESFCSIKTLLIERGTVRHLKENGSFWKAGAFLGGALQFFRNLPASGA